MKKLHYNFPKMNEGGVEGHLEFFQKFIRLGSAILPFRTCLDDNSKIATSRVMQK